MGFGVGLGAFVDGFTRGVGISQDLADREQLRKDRELDRANQDEQRQWAREDRAFETKQRQRAQSQQDAIDAVNQDAKDTFDAGVKAGTQKEGDFDTFWTQYALPKMKHELLLQGDVQGAAALDTWGQTEAAKKGGKLFAGALLKAQTGDLGGALDDAIAAGKLQGYLDHDFDLKSKEEILDTGGNIVGYRVHISDGNGNELEQDIALDDIPTVISTFANPAAAWESQRAAAAKKSERNAEIEDYRTKKEIDATAEGGSKARSAAIAALRKRDEDLMPGDDTPRFDQLADAEQEAAIAKEVALQKGTRAPALPDPKILVDSQLGQQVGIGGAQPTSAAPGLGSVPSWPKAAGSTGDAQVDASLNLPSKAQVVKNAADMMVAGKDPNEIARMLAATGIDPAEWPAGLSNAVNPGGTARSPSGL